MATAASVQDRTPTAFLRRITAASAIGQGLDGYDLGIISVLLITIQSELHMGPFQTGLIGASSLIGIFIGGPLFGYITDRFGRRLTFTVDLVVFLAAAVAQVFVQETWQLFVVRLVLGIAIGAEYSIGAPMLSEFSPAKGRGRRLSFLEVGWYVGYVVAVAISYLLFHVFGVSWRLTLATGAVPAIACLFVRIGLPESPRWLVSRGRIDEAKEIVYQHLGKKFWEDEDFEGEEKGHDSFGESVKILFAPGQRSKTIFACSFYAMLVAPYFAISTFEPTLLKGLNIGDPDIGTIAVNAVAALGAVAGALLIEKLGRRQLLIGPFWICAGALAVVGVWGAAPGLIIVFCFMVFAFFNATSSDLTTVYLPELFPTSVRTTGSGVATAASRISAAIGTFLVPTSIAHLGTPVTMLIGAAICAGGAVLSHVYAPETTGVSLTKATRLPSMGRVPSGATG